MHGVWLLKDIKKAHAKPLFSFATFLFWRLRTEQALVKRMFVALKKKSSAYAPKSAYFRQILGCLSYLFIIILGR